MQWTTFEHLPACLVSLSKVLPVALPHISEKGLLPCQHHHVNWIAMRRHRLDLPFQLRCMLKSSAISITRKS
jgi:hypothetical protein